MNRAAWLLALTSLASAGDAIEWSASIEAASRQSARDGRPVLLYFTFDT